VLTAFAFLALAPSALAVSTLTLEVQPTQVVGEPVGFRATLTGTNSSPGGRITVIAYRPGDDNCLFPGTTVADELATSSPVVGDFTPATPGTYRLRAFFNGNPLDAPAETACNAPNTTAVVSEKPQPQPQPGPPGPPGQDAADGPRCHTETATIVGTAGPETITGTSKADVIAALGGDDVVRGLRGDDLLCGGGGDDEVRGGRGDDLLRGGGGHDLCAGGQGEDDASHSCQEVTGVP
jgi:Ca2+-binding RTX toxin-like protein